MPYAVRKQGNEYTVYKKKADGSTGEKVGSTAGNKEALRKYLAALHINAKESISENKMINLNKLRELIAESVREVLAEKKIEPNKKKKTKSTTEKEAEKVTKTAEKDSKSYIKKKYGNKFTTMLEKPPIKLKEILNDED